MNRKKRCPFCRQGMKRHFAILYDGRGSTCLTSNVRKPDIRAIREEKLEKWKAVWLAFGRLSGGQEPIEKEVV